MCYNKDMAKKKAQAKRGRRSLYRPELDEYVDGQKWWVKEKGVEIGDMVKIIRLWEREDNGFPLGCGDLSEGTTGKIVGFNGGGTDYDGEGLEVSVNGETLCLPYFALEVVKL